MKSHHRNREEHPQGESDVFTPEVEEQTSQRFAFNTLESNQPLGETVALATFERKSQWLWHIFPPRAFLGLLPQISTRFLADCRQMAPRMLPQTMIP